MKNKKNLKEIYITEDYSKEVLQKRKQLQAELVEERKKGNFAYLKYDKLIVKQNNNQQEKRKRESSASPSSLNNQAKKQQSHLATKSNRADAFDMIRHLNSGERNPKPSKATDNKYRTYDKSPPNRLVIAGERDHHLPTKEEEKNILKNKYEETKIYVAALNVRTLKEEENLTELIYALEKIKWDIIGLSEVRRVDESIVVQPDYLLYHIGETPGQYGVGFIIKDQVIEYVEEFIAISERIAIMNLKLPGYKAPWSIVQIYSPTEQAKDDTINKFYFDLNRAIIDHCHKNLIILGDFNGHIGKRRPGEESAIGSFTYINKI
ncbi:craniofacial development protein 2-like [Vanessa atalanta]|uniref:craniofacial development protein 2-like n=1 Tax=Vanessa atalanta TaxID=42275 RepID=UPI001FCCDAE8|nr:craniofacial development protein 2-like [Vanessa atalanta]